MICNPKFKIYISELILDSFEYVPVAYVAYVTMIVSHFVDAGNFLIRYSDECTYIRTCSISYFLFLLWIYGT